MGSSKQNKAPKPNYVPSKPDYVPALLRYSDMMAGEEQLSGAFEFAILWPDFARQNDAKELAQIVELAVPRLEALLEKERGVQQCALRALGAVGGSLYRVAYDHDSQTNIVVKLAIDPFGMRFEGIFKKSTSF